MVVPSTQMLMSQEDSWESVANWESFSDEMKNLQNMKREKE
jgi:hypothetical protein